MKNPAEVRPDVSALASAVTAKEIEALLCDLIKIESHEASDGHETQVVAYIESYFKTHGIPVELDPVIDNRCNLIARIPGEGGGPTLMLNGHTDTVSPYQMKNAFMPRVTEDRIVGRGSVDMKGALAAMMGVLVCLKRNEVALRGDVLFVATIGEEQYSPGANHLVESGFHADFAIVGEPTGMEVGIAHKGVLWCEAEFKGRSVHGSVPEKGVNAICHAAQWIEKLRTEYLPSLKLKQHALLGAPSFNVGVIKGGTRPVIVPDGCRVEFERRLLPGETSEQVLAELNAGLAAMAAEDPTFKGTVKEMSVFHGVPHLPLESNPDGPLVRALLEAREREFRCEPDHKPCGLSFWTDAALLNRIPGMQAVVCGPGNIEQAHSNEEFISRSQLHSAYRIYLEAAVTLCSSKKSVSQSSSQEPRAKS